jgi:hypothetical protein
MSPQPDVQQPVTVRHSDYDCEQKTQYPDLAGEIRNLKTEIATKQDAVESKVGDSSDNKSEALNAGIQTDGTLVLIKGLTITLHMRDEQSDLVMRADLSGEGLAAD